MNCKVFALIICIMPAAFCAANETHVPEKNSKAYSVMVEAGAKLLEFDIIRAHINVQEKKLVADLQHEQFTSTASKALGVLGPLEDLAHGFDDVIPVFLLLQKEIKNNPINTTIVGKTQIAQALNGLVSMLASPEVLHVVLPPSELVGPAYLSAMGFLPTAKFAKTIQAIAHKKFMLNYCDENDQLVNEQKLTNDAHLFYSVVKQTVANMFTDLMKAAVVTSAVPVMNQPTKIEPKVADKMPVEVKIVTKPAETAFSNLPPQEMLMQAILHDSAEEVEAAAKAGADINFCKDDKPVLLWALLLNKPNSIEKLVQLGVFLDFHYQGKDLFELILEKCNPRTRFVSTLLNLLGTDFILFKNYVGKKLDDAVLHSFAIIHGLIQNVMRSNGIILSHEDNEYLILKRNNLLNILENRLLTVFLQKLVKSGYSSDRIIELTQWQSYRFFLYQKAILKILLDNGLNPNLMMVLQEFTWTPLLEASGIGETEAVELLLKAGAKLNQQVSIEHFGWPPARSCTPLLAALRNWSSDQDMSDMVKFLLQNGANVNEIIGGKKTTTPLLVATYHGNLSAIKMLLNAGADINQKANPFPECDEAFTPLALALKNDRQDIAQFLMQNGASL